jgi:N-acylneuraminate cytidylyltransferase
MIVYAFIFARGGSKGLPGKNIRPLGGIPLIGHSIGVARQVPAIARVFVSTDSEEIASVAREFGAEVIRRPDDLASDTAPEWLSWQHAVRTLEERGDKFDVFVSLPATAPLRAPVDVRNCLDALDPATDAVVTVTPAARNPWFNMLVRDDDGTSRMVCAGDGVTRRQDAPSVYDMTTVAYVTRPDFILTQERLFTGRVKSVVVPKERAIDIDDIYDFKMAEFLLGQEGTAHAE